MIREGELIQKQCIGSLEELTQQLFVRLQENPGERIAFFGKTHSTLKTIVDFERMLGPGFHPVCIIDNHKRGDFSKSIPVLTFAEAERMADGIDLIVVMVDSASIYAILAQIAESRLFEKKLLSVHRDSDPLSETEFQTLCRESQSFLSQRGVIWYTSEENWYCCYQYLKQVATLPGDVAEFGVFRGGSAYWIATVLKHLRADKRLFLFDTFAGIPVQSAIDHVGEKSFADSDLKRVRALFSGFENVRIVPGDVCDTLEASGLGEVSLAHIDCDQYHPTRYLCERLYDRVIPGGIFLFQNYSLGAAYGERVAVDLFFRDKPENVLFGFDGAAFVVKL